MFSNKDLMNMLVPIWIRVAIIVCIVLMILGIKEVIDIINAIIG